MRYIKPEYYDAFECIADRCPDTCCAGWQIVIDEASLEKYNAAGISGIDWTEGSFVQRNGRCSMLNNHNLCDLILQKGEDWLCETCKRYPRHVEEFDGLREYSLSLSCPVAAEMMLNRQEKLTFLVEEDDLAEPLEEEFEEFDFLLFTQLEDARKVLFAMVQNREAPMTERMVLALEMARQMQLCVDEGRLYDVEEVIQRYAVLSPGTSKMLNAEPDKRKSGEEKPRYRDMKKCFEVLKRMEHLREEWTDTLTLTEDTLYARGEEAYQRIYDAFCREYIGIAAKKQQWEIFQEQILMFFLYTYFCGAVYDDCIYSKAALGVFSVSMIQELVMCRWYLTDKYIDRMECIRLAYRYAREVEHSDENLILLEEWLLETMEP